MKLDSWFVFTIELKWFKSTDWDWRLADDGLLWLRFNGLDCWCCCCCWCWCSKSWCWCCSSWLDWWWLWWWRCIEWPNWLGVRLSTGEFWPLFRLAWDCCCCCCCCIWWAADDVDDEEEEDDEDDDGELVTEELFRLFAAWALSFRNKKKIFFKNFWKIQFWICYLKTKFFFWNWA